MKDLRLINKESGDQVTFDQFYDYYFSTRTKLKKQLWKFKQEIVIAIKDFN